MNREILFRGKRIDNGEWVYGSLISRPFGYSENQKEYSAIIIFDKHDGSHYDAYLELQVIPETVGQFTGLTDKNGTKIFEGDLLSVFDHYNDAWSTDSAPVIFSHEYVGGWVITNWKENLTIGKRKDKLQITSNIYDKPTP